MDKYDKMIVFILLKVCRILAKCSKDSVDTYIYLIENEFKKWEEMKDE